MKFRVTTQATEVAKLTLKRATLTKLKQLLVKVAALHRENFVLTCGSISPNVLAGRELCAICAIRSMRTLERQVTSVIIYSVIIKINTGLNLILMGRSGTP